MKTHFLSQINYHSLLFPFSEKKLLQSILIKSFYFIILFQVYKKITKIIQHSSTLPTQFLLLLTADISTVHLSKPMNRYSSSLSLYLICFSIPGSYLKYLILPISFFINTQTKMLIYFTSCFLVIYFSSDNAGSKLESCSHTIAD